MSHDQPTPTAVFYLRSGGAPSEATMQTLARQRSACQQRANELGLVVRGEYVDRGGSVEPDDRPGLSQLLVDLLELPIDYVIAYDHTHIAWRMTSYASVVWAIGKRGAQLEIASLPHRETDTVELLLIGRVGSLQLAEIEPKERAEQPDTDPAEPE